MNTFYTVDRRGLCSVDGKLTLTKPSVHFSLSPTQSIQDIEDKLNSLFKFHEGLSPHRMNYFLGNAQYFSVNGVSTISVEPVIESIWELVRLNFFPEQPSRFQVYFGWKELEEAVRFLRLNNNPQYSIYKIQCEDFHKKDMNLLNMGTSNISAIDLAHKYWSGEESCSPQFEYLLVPEISVLERIDRTLFSL
jgi:hypothetical protein